LENPDKVLDILVGNDTKPIDSTRAGSMTRLSDTLQNAVNDYFSPSINNLETQSKNIALQIAQYTAELNNITNSLSLDDPNGGIGDVSEYLKQLEEQYEAVNKLIKKMKNNYNNSITRLALRV
jgi:archaellum component FlaC